MINKTDSEEIKEIKPTETPVPDDAAGLMLSGFFKISDPETGDILVSGRS